MLKKMYYAVVTYVTLGLLSGLFYREFTKMNDFSGWTQLRGVHTHFLALGVLVFLALMALERLLDLGQLKSFRTFFVVYNIGLLLSGVMMIVKGCLQVLGSGAANSAMLAGFAGLGHMTLTAAFILLLVALKKRIWAVDAQAA